VPGYCAPDVVGKIGIVGVFTHHILTSGYQCFGPPGIDDDGWCPASRVATDAAAIAGAMRRGLLSVSVLFSYFVLFAHEQAVHDFPPSSFGQSESGSMPW